MKFQYEKKKLNLFSFGRKNRKTFT